MIAKTITAALFSILLASTAHAGSGPIKSVKLSSGGVAEIVRAAAVDESGTVEIDVPLSQVDDLLKSLVVFSDKAAVRDLSLAGPQPVEETFERLPFTPSDMDSLARIVGAMKGSKVILNGEGGITYTIVGVEQGDKTASVILLSPAGDLTKAPLGGSTKIRFADVQAQAKIDEALSILATAANDSMRTVKIRLAQTSEKEVDISYVVAAPIWKPTYKLAVRDDGKAALQGWAVLENASGEDWKDVALTLSSGKPVTLQQHLHERIWKNREEVRPELAGGAIASKGSRNFLEKSLVALAAPAPTVSADFAEVAAAPEKATSELAISNFEIPGTFSVRNGDTLSVPVVSKEVEAGFVALFDENAAHPQAALLIKNTTGSALPAGIMTVYDSKGGYVGDAKFGDLPSGASTTAVFGTDLKLDQFREVQATAVIKQVKLERGVLRASKIATITDTWKVKAGDEGRTVVVEDTVPEGYHVVAGQVVEETPKGIRVKAAVKPGETAALVVKYERDAVEELFASDPDQSAIQLWVSDAADDAVRAKLQEVLDATSALSEAKQALQASDDRYAEIVKEQVRIRENLAEVNEEKLKTRWVGKMTDLEDEIDTLNATRQKNLKQVDLLRKKLGDKVQAF